MRFIDVDAGFDQLKMSRWRHKLADHPLMTTQSLAELALRIDPDYVRFHDGERRVGTNMNEMMTTDSNRDHLRRALENLHTAKTFVQIINVCSDPAYGALVDDVLDEALPFLPSRDHYLLNRDAAVFLASPMSVTPFHLDHEQNFLCHIRGPKTFYVWDHRDRSVVGERALEVFYRERRLRDVTYQADMQPKAHAVELTPGDCIYMPMGSPHAASTGNDVTVTFSVLMNTRSSFETVETYKVNYMLRRLGLSPKPVGVSEVRDSLKHHTLGAVRRLRDLAQGRSKDRRLHWY
jgi:hypothetical protein